MRKVKSVLLGLFILLSLNAFSQREFTPVHGGCLPEVTDVSDEVTADHRSGRLMLPTIKTDWNPNQVYRQMVVLIEFADTTFTYSKDPKAFYDKLFNESGFNDGNGPGCVADYYRDQSEGMLNLKFDIYGPVKVSTKAQPYDKPTENTKNYGRESYTEALQKLITAYPDIDYSVYDWNGDKKIEQVIIIYAYTPGNSGASTYGYIWPNTSSISTITTPDGYKISNYTSSGELWPTKSLISCGLGTICHEFSHSLGLPDIYPTAGNAGYSVCDEWDLMDGGNFTNYGWCPPNFTPVEKWIMGWLSFTDLDEPTSITDLKPVAEGGEAYRIKHSENEWLILENRQQRGWDVGAPGKGLVIYHVCYDKSVWNSNTVNNNASMRRFELIHADNMDYDAWRAYLDANEVGTYVNKKYMNSRLLSTSPYPWTVDSIGFINDSLTDNSVPAPKMNYVNEQGERLLRKAITNISMSEDGLISFDFMGGNQTGIANHNCQNVNLEPQLYDLSGRKVSHSGHRGLYLRRDKNGVVRKML